MTTRDPHSSSSSPDLHPAAVPDAGAPQERAGLLAALRGARQHMRHAEGCGLSLHLGEHRCSCGMLHDDAAVKAAIDKLKVAPAAHQERTEPSLAQAARSLANVLPDVVVESLRGEWGNSNVAVVKHWRDETLRLLDGAPARAAEWQPIETAPKDRPILVFMRDDALCRAWQYEDGDPSKRVALAAWTTHNGGGWTSYHPGVPTHWMPLPLPPGALAGDSNSKR